MPPLPEDYCSTKLKGKGEGNQTMSNRVIKPIMLVVLLVAILGGCTTPLTRIDGSSQEIDLESLSQEALEAQLLSQETLDPEVLNLLNQFISTLDGSEFILAEDGNLYLIISSGHEGADILTQLINQDSSLFGLQVEVELDQSLGGQSLSLQFPGLFLPSLLTGTRETGWLWQLTQEETSGTGIFPDYPSSLTANLSLPGDIQNSTKIVHQGVLFDVSFQWEVVPLIIPEIFRREPFYQLPKELYSEAPVAALLLPQLYGYERFSQSDFSSAALRLYTPQDSGFLDLVLSLGGSFHLRRQNHNGFFFPDQGQSSWFPISIQRTQDRGFGTTLPRRASVLPTTIFRSAPVLGAESYELLAGGEILFQTSVPTIQRNNEPVFALPGQSSLVFTALRGTRPLLEVSYTLTLGPNLPRTLPVNSPGFVGQVMEFPLTNQEFLPLIQYLMELGHVEIHQLASLQGSNLVDAQSGIRLLGVGSLDFGNQFGLELQGGALSIRPDRGNHPMIGLSWIGAGRIAWVMAILSGMDQRVLPPRVTGLIDDSPGIWRLPLEDEWVSFSQTRVGFRPTQTTVNYFRSFDPYEDPNPPHTRQGGPTNPIRTFPPDSIFGLYSTRGNVWEWVQDVIPLSEIPELATGELDQRLVYRRVLGGAWNTPLSGFGPRGLDIPRGRFPENHTSWSLGVRFVISDEPTRPNEPTQSVQPDEPLLIQ
jgi:hypothetical protein